ncbi:lycopene cyclase domain-containing protein [Enemella sp. A6]|uniref:lycopene cyclase domain-containing protein n=1 Tax=Enemella sp. A6 TaxID=3440152 RepID=UPI003EBF0588
MTYPLITLPFLAVTAVLVAISATRPWFRRRMVTSTITVGVLFVLTAIFDNVMIASGLFTYPDTHISGVRIGLAPIEDFAYPLCAAYGIPALYTLLPEREPRR